MINISTNRKKYIVRPTQSQTLESTYEIQYVVSISGSTIFTGRARYFGNQSDFNSVFEVDCSDFIDAYIAKQINNISSVTVSVAFTFYNSSGSSIGSETLPVTWAPEATNLPRPDMTSAYALLYTQNSGFTNSDGSTYIPLSIKNGVLEGKTINKLEKNTFMDRYGDTHNGSMTNHYEVECFVDPCWLGSVKTKGDLDYERVMLMLQNSQRTILYCQYCNISGITPSPINSWNCDCHIKNVERIETYSSYSGNQKVPTYKITIEIYNH